MKKILLWIGIGCAMYVPLHASADGYTKRVMVVAGYVRQTSDGYVPSCIRDLVHRYWAAKRTEIGEAFVLKGFQGFCSFRCLAFVPPASLATIGLDLDKKQNILVVWDVKKDQQVFTKVYCDARLPRHMLSIPHGAKDGVILAHANKTLSYLDLTTQREKVFTGKLRYFVDNLVPSRDGKGLVTIGGTSHIKEVIYWDLDACALRMRFDLSSVQDSKAFNPESLVSFIDAEQFAILGSYDAVDKRCQRLYVYHRRRQGIVRQVEVNIPPPFNRSHCTARFCIGRWLVMPTARGFWCYDMACAQHYHAPYAHEGRCVYNILALDTSQFVLMTKDAKGHSAAIKATLCALEKLPESVCIRTYGSHVIADDTTFGWINYTTIVLLGSHFILKNYWHGDIALHPLT